MVAFDDSAMSMSTRELASWKEIAHHLGVNVRTAQKWERERGLPVRRSAGSRSRVSADAATLETWKQQLAETSRLEERCYSWPLGHGTSVEVRFLGSELTPAHIELLRRYLQLAKSALSGNSQPAHPKR